ncbi:ferritin family protein [Candidatus Bipolaricaulota bacterium]|nr:ferritin family protein [Candidatus Bipolaricaulota bacterium]
MSFSFNADEILKMAEQIERNGARFYRSAADAGFDQDISGKLLELAEMEDTHEKTFATMRGELDNRETESIAFDPEGQTERYLMAMADSSIFDQTVDPSDQVRGKTIEQVLNVALETEKASILFYLGLENLVPERLGKGKVAGIVKEEMAHVVLIKGHLAAL